MSKIISLLFCLLMQVIYIEKAFGQKLDIVTPREDQVFADTVLLSWNTIDAQQNYKLYISTTEDFSNVDSFAVNNQSQFAFLPDSSVNSEYHFYVQGVFNTSLIRSDTVSFTYFNPKNIPGLKLWISSDYGIDTLNSHVVQWNDRSGNGNNLVMANTSRQPTLLLNGLNKYPNVFFDAIDDGMSSPLVLDSTDYMMTVLYNCLDSANTIRRTIHGSNNWLAGKYGTSYNIFAGAFTGGKSYSIGAYVVQSAKFSTDTLKNYINAVQYGKVRPSRFPLQLGLGSWTGSNATNGNINEWLVYDTTINDSIRLLIEKYVMDKYAPPISLGADIKTCSFPMGFSAERNYIKSYLWSDSTTSSFFSASSPGKYWLRSTDIFGRTFSDTIIISLDTSDMPVELPPDTTLCLGEVLKLDAGPDQYTYSWNNGSQASGISVDSSGKYIVSRTNCLLSTSKDSIEVHFNLPRFSLGADTSICFNTSFSLRADSVFGPSVDYSWNTGSSLDSILVDSTAQYILQVVDAYGCTFSDSIVVTIDSSLINVDLGNDTALCKGNRIGLQASNSHIISYSWSTGSMDSTIAVDSSQVYYLNVSSARCSYTDSIRVDIKGLAPFVDFSFSNLCHGDSVLFTDSSASLDQSDIISWEWDFGNGRSSNVQNPIFAFDSIGSKTVTLEVATDSSCIAKAQKQVQIFPKPIADFEYGTACENHKITFSDSTKVSTGTIANYKWDFAGKGSDTVVNPEFTFDTFGTYKVVLAVESSNSCRDTAVKFINVNPVPRADISYEGSCFGDSTLLMSNSAIPNGFIEKYEWNLGNGINSQGMNTATYYYQPGYYTIYLKTTSDKECTALFVDTIDIKPLPIADFVFPDFCEGDTLKVKSTSIAVRDSLIHYQYTVNGVDTSHQKNPQFGIRAPGDYNLSLFVESASGCMDSIDKTVTVHQNPVADFQILNQYRSVPMELDIINLSQGADSFLWKFGNGDTSTLKLPKYMYVDTGLFTVELFAFNTNGCTDSISRSFRLYPSFLDASIEELEMLDNSGLVNVKGTIVNTGASIINELVVKVTFENGLEFTEVVNSDIMPGGMVEVALSNSLFIEDVPAFVCMEIIGVNRGLDEISTNNRKCAAGPEKNFIINISPNPVSTTLEIHLILPNSGNLNLELFDKNAQQVLQIANGRYSEGYHYFEIEMENLATGVYFIKGLFNGQSVNKKLIKY